MSPDIAARVYLYLRVSSEEQAEHGISLEAQEARARRWASAYPGLVIVDVISDAGVSGKNMDRPGMCRVLADLDSGAIDGVLVANLLRLTRSSSDWADLMSRYFGPHVRPKRQRQLFSVEDLVDTRTPIGRFILTIRIAAAQLEREETGDRTSKVLRHIQARGVHLGPAPFGWRRIRTPACTPLDRCACGSCGKLEEVAEEQGILEGMRAKRGEGWSLARIGAWLTAAGIVGRRGGAWTPMSVRRVLGEDGKAVAA